MSLNFEFEAEFGARLGLKTIQRLSARDWLSHNLQGKASGNSFRSVYRT